MTRRPVTRDAVFALRLFVATYTVQNGYPPSCREAAEARGMAYSSVAYLLKRMDGVSPRHRGTHRSITFRASR